MVQQMALSAEVLRAAKQNRGRIGFGPGDCVIRVGETEECDFRWGYGGGVGEGGGRKVRWEGGGWWDEL